MLYAIDKGHYASDSKNKKVKGVEYYSKKLEYSKRRENKGKARMAEEESDSSSSDDEVDDITNFCLMAKEYTSPKYSDSNQEVDWMYAGNKLGV
ncbi:hypothetical protein HanXRQr2_Chr15g0702611 [Helianthus annuus]|uniref:Uncharacterized protein n=1 Tax=Helianthus annuus TaxID=4232 RepID=A0A251S6F6_HELAN|nr:hypothetical protein HanXRQr2_Chr15g0702611 [Helianthus annuus]KAJ0832035.1 hypothetical protein HanPSC8_Chr15g0674121 [Helianthus annuus]